MRLLLTGSVVVAALLVAADIRDQTALDQLYPESATAAVVQTHQGKGVKWWARRAVQARKDANARGKTISRLRRALHKASHEVSPTLAIRIVFGRYAGSALRVAWCESKWFVGARNGQYRGIFQMGSSERRLYGHGPDALSQAQAAYRYFVASGRDWGPWTCKP